MSGPRAEDELGEVIIEIRRVGAAQRVAAVCARTGVEVVIQAPAGASRAEVEALVLQKLDKARGRIEAGAAPNRPGKFV